MPGDGEPSNQNEKAFGVTNIKFHVPILLNFDALNYDHWKELFETHCEIFEVDNHLKGTKRKNVDDQTWKKMDSLVKVWVYSTVKPDVLGMIMKKGGTAYEIWTNINKLFLDNKEARATELETELRNMELGDKSISEYCNRIKVISDLLENIDEPVSERNLVMYTINGLSDKYEQVAGIIRHQKPLPKFLDVRSMLLEEESILNRTRASKNYIKDNSSAPTVLYAGNNTT